MEKAGRTFQKSHPVKDRAILATFASEFDKCWACHKRPFDWRGSFGLHVHHIIKPGRSDERCNLARLCLQCHMLAEGERIKDDWGDVIPTLKLENVLWLKQEADQEHWNPTRLKELYHRSLPILESVPHWYLIERARP